MPFSQLGMSSFPSRRCEIHQFALQCIARVCFRLDHESTDPDSRAGCVSYYGSGRRIDDLMRSAEVRAQQASAIVSPRPTCNTSTTAVRSDGQTKHELSINTSLAGNLPVVSYGLPDEFDIEVRIERAMIRDAMPPYGGSTDQELYATPHNSQDCYA